MVHLGKYPLLPTTLYMIVTLFLQLPLLILVGLAMLKDWVPQLRLLARQPLNYLQERLMI